VRCAPLVSIDLLVFDEQGRALVGLRTNEPARDTYFVPGGVVRKNERLGDAFRRILGAETGVTADVGDAQFRGVYEHLYHVSRLGGSAFGTHYVVLAYALPLNRPVKLALDRQHRAFRWMSPSELLAAPDVHGYTKAYFQ
jgi:colanic acid biosynthesis protein WcaH